MNCSSSQRSDVKLFKERVDFLFSSRDSVSSSKERYSTRFRLREKTDQTPWPSTSHCLSLFSSDKLVSNSRGMLSKRSQMLFQVSRVVKRFEKGMAFEVITPRGNQDLDQSLRKNWQSKSLDKISMRRERGERRIEIKKNEEMVGHSHMLGTGGLTSDMFLVREYFEFFAQDSHVTKMKMSQEELPLHSQSIFQKEDSILPMISLTCHQQTPQESGLWIE